MTQINWRKGEEHPKTFEHGETMLVAVGLNGVGYLVGMIAARVEDGDCDFMVGCEPWDWDWEDVAWWIPIEEIEATLPKPTKETP